MSTQAPVVRELNHVALHVRDLEISERFYGIVLQLPRLPRPDFDFPGAWFALGTQELHLIVDAERRGDERTTSHIAFKVDDARAAMEILKERGVEEISGPVQRPDGATQIFFSDPDGHRIEMVSEPDKG